MDRVYQANAVETPPEPVAPSGSYPTAGSKTTGQVATIPGPYWFYSVTEELRNALIAVGLTPDPAKVNQLAEAFAKFLPLSGGTMTGNLKFANNKEIQTATDDNYLAIYGGTGYRHGSRLTLGGIAHGTYKSTFHLIADDGTTECALIGRADKRLVWADGQVITTTQPLVPDYHSGIGITSPFTAPSAGIVVVQSTGSYGGVTNLIVNGKQVGIYKTTDHMDSSCTAWVNKGDVCSYTIGGSNTSAMFYPLKVGG